MREYKMVCKSIFSWLIVFLWMSFIFFMSSMNNVKTNSTSKSVINKTIEKTVETTNGLGITDKHPSATKMEYVIEFLNKPIRKVAHASEYFILAILLINALINGDVNKKYILLMALLICFVYSCSDEYHQTFVSGRTGQFSDCLIDTSGAFIGCLIYKLSMIFKFNKA